jgi:hypothetical protein
MKTEIRKTPNIEGRRRSLARVLSSTFDVRRWDFDVFLNHLA